MIPSQQTLSTHLEKYSNCYLQRVRDFNLLLLEEILTYNKTFFRNELKFSEVLFCYLNNITLSPICSHCTINKVSFISFRKGYMSYCSVKCSSNSVVKKTSIGSTNLKLYGHENIAQGTFKEKIRLKSVNNYGVDYPTQAKIVKDKIIATNLERYAVPFAIQAASVQAKKLLTFSKNYGATSPMKSKKVVDKMLATRKAKGQIYKYDNLTDYKQYRQAVLHFTNISFCKYYYEINPTCLPRGRKEYVVDHIFPVIECFKNNVIPSLVAHKNNLQILWWKDNRAKAAKTNKSIQDFYNLITK